MDAWQDLALAVIEAQARRRAGACSRRLINADADELERIRARLEFELWLAENARFARRM
jgi:hypothetical protein